MNLKKLTTAAAVYGPYLSVEPIEGGWRCRMEGGLADLATAVIGEATVGDWEGPPPDAAVHVPVPASVSMAQARLALLQRDLLDDVEVAMAAQPRAVRIEWEFRTSVDRASPLVAGMQAILGLSDAEVDELFQLAGSL